MPTEIAAKLVADWLKDFPGSSEGVTDIAVGDLIRRIAAILADKK